MIVFNYYILVFKRTIRVQFYPYIPFSLNILSTFLVLIILFLEYYKHLPFFLHYFHEINMMGVLPNYSQKSNIIYQLLFILLKMNKSNRYQLAMNRQLDDQPHPLKSLKNIFLSSKDHYKYTDLELMSVKEHHLVGYKEMIHFKQRTTKTRKMTRAESGYKDKDEMQLIKVIQKNVLMNKAEIESVRLNVQNIDKSLLIIEMEKKNSIQPIQFSVSKVKQRLNTYESIWKGNDTKYVKLPSLQKSIEVFRDKVYNLQKNKTQLSTSSSRMEKWMENLRTKDNKVEQPKQITKYLTDRMQFLTKGSSKLKSQKSWMARLEQKGYMFMMIDESKPTVLRS